jgi:hypothetical protein
MVKGIARAGSRSGSRIDIGPRVRGRHEERATLGLNEGLVVRQTARPEIVSMGETEFREAVAAMQRGDFRAAEQNRARKWRRG